MQLVEHRDPVVPVDAACRALNVSRASLYRSWGSTVKQTLVSRVRAPNPRRLDDVARQRILDTLHLPPMCQGSCRMTLVADGRCRNRARGTKVTVIPYSQQFRNRMVQKLVGAHAVSATALSAEVGISQGTLSRWLKQAATIPSTMSSADNDTKAHDWSPEQKVAFVLESAAVANAELGAFLRRRGVLEAQLDEWRKQVTDGAVASMRPPTRGDREAAAADSKKIRQLERELLRKDKALAETAALLVLKKKAQAIWGDEDDDTDPKSDK